MRIKGMRTKWGGLTAGGGQVAVRLLLAEGLESLTPAHDLNAAQLCALGEALGGAAGRLEAVVHQHLPIFHTEHCVFCRFLSDGQASRSAPPRSAPPGFARPWLGTPPPPLVLFPGPLLLLRTDATMLAAA